MYDHEPAAAPARLVDGRGDGRLPLGGPDEAADNRVAHAANRPFRDVPCTACAAAGLGLREVPTNRLPSFSNRFAGLLPLGTGVAMPFGFWIAVSVRSTPAITD